MKILKDTMIWQVVAERYVKAALVDILKATFSVSTAVAICNSTFGVREWLRRYLARTIDSVL